MFRARILAAVVVLGAFAAFAASPAGAARPVLGFPELLTTAHFQIHYSGDLADPSRIVAQQAGDLAALAEQAYTTEITTWGYPTPPDDGDGKIDIWVEDLGDPSILGAAVPDGAIPGTGWIVITPASVGYEHVIAHELFHLIQFGIWDPADSWLLEATAEWTGFAADSFDPYTGGKIQDTFEQPDMSLDCLSDACGPDGYENFGYSRWPFFQYLAERFGNTFVKDVFAAGAALGNPPAKAVAALSSALTAKGTTLSDTFNDYTAHLVSGNFQALALKGLAPTTFESATATGAVTGSLPVVRVPVNHLAAQYLAYIRGDVKNLGACYAATLSLTVAMPAGLGSKPTFYSSGDGTAAIPLSINGSTASANIPWDTCTGGPNGYLALPNPSLATDSAMFTVSGSVTVDLNTPATGALPPDPLYAGPGTVVASPTTDVAPSTFVYGAQVIRVSTVDRMVRLIVFSSGEGQLQASAGTKNLGTYQLRAGNNDVRFKLPQSIVNALRKPAGRSVSASVLTLKFLSPGGVAGTSVSRKLTLVKPTPTKKKKD
ncbi:MAG: hypothetical protein ACXVZN_03125 [Gaiellaceae bacterium]